MTIGLVKQGGWAANSTLTSSDLNSIQTTVTRALDRTAAGDTLAGPITLTGAGRIIPTPAVGPDSAYTINVGQTSTVFQLTSTLTADRVYTLNVTGAATGDIVTVFANADCTRVVTVRSSAAPSTDLFKVGNVNSADGSWATFIYIGGWRLYQHAIGSRMRRDEFLTSGTWTCPAGVTNVLLYGFGGGSAGGNSYYTQTYTYFVGSSGGAGAPPGWMSVPVTAGTTYTVTIGAGGTATGTRAGGTTWFGSTSLAQWPGSFPAANGFLTLGSGGYITGNYNLVSRPGIPWPNATDAVYDNDAKVSVLELAANVYYAGFQQIGGFGGYTTASGNSSAFAPTYGRQFTSDGRFFSGGAPGTNNGAGGGGGGGGAGPGGPGGVGGTGQTVNNTWNATNGGNASANSGAGGGGAGGGLVSSSAAATGGSGGSGAMWIHYVK